MNTFNKNFFLFLGLWLMLGCANVKQVVREPDASLPLQYRQPSDTANVAGLPWRSYFQDANLQALIDTALARNQELAMVLQEIEVSKNEVRARKGEYLPFVSGIAGSGIDKNGTYTREGKLDELLAENGKKLANPLGDFIVGASASWEIDVWRKLRNARQAALKRYLSSVEGKNFLVTQLVAEIAENYYTLMALDNLLQTINENVEIQSNALLSVKLQKESAKVTQLAVNRFEAQLLKTKNRQYEIRLEFVEKDNRLYFLTGRFPSSISRSSSTFFALPADSLKAGVPSQLLDNRPDIKQAELKLAASKLDVKSARARFYPSFGIRSGFGWNAYNASFLLNPQSVLWNMTGDLVAPLVNRNAIKAAYNAANARQLQAVVEYEQTLLKAYVEVQNQLAKLENYTQSYAVKADELAILEQSVGIANSLFNSARADYVEVLLTQEEVLEAKLELIEVKAKLLEGKVNLYRSLGGGWR